MLFAYMYVSKMASFKGPKTPLLVDVKPEAQGVNAQFQICTGRAWGHTTTGCVLLSRLVCHSARKYAVCGQKNSYFYNLVHSAAGWENLFVSSGLLK